jgi:hypothetical protein
MGQDLHSERGAGPIKARGLQQAAGRRLQAQDGARDVEPGRPSGRLTRELDHAHPTEAACA